MKRCSVLLGLTIGVITSVPLSAKEINGHHHHGDRRSMHGMAVFGESSHYFAHIPMMRRPHNEQLVFSVTLRNAQGQLVKTAFKGQGYSFKPAKNFSLDDLAIGKVKEIAGDIHEGNFEHGGAVLLKNIVAQVKEIIVARNLEDNASSKEEFFVVGKGELWLVNRITSNSNVQSIAQISVEKMDGAKTDSFAPKVTRLDENNEKYLVIKKAGVNENSKYKIKSLKRIWCLKGPDFFDSCL